MYRFSKRSEEALYTCHNDLVLVCKEAIRVVDFTILEGHRTREKHEEYIHKGVTTVPYERSKHSHKPSLAVDIVPYPIDWQDLDAFRYLAGVMMGVASCKNIKLQWGGHWKKFIDMPHFQLVINN